MHVNVHAIVLRNDRAAADGARRLTLYTREKGRLYALVRGVGKPRSRLAAAVEPAVEARFRLWQEPGRGTARVTGGAVARGFPALRADWSRMAAALFLCEWTEALTPLEQPHPEKYDLLRAALAALESGDETAVRLTFLTRFLEQAGYALGPDVLGPEAYARWRAPVEVLRRAEVATVGPSAEITAAAAALEQRILLFVAPLLARPLKTPAHRRDLRDYMARAAAAAPKSGKAVPA